MSINGDLDENIDFAEDYKLFVKSGGKIYPASKSITDGYAESDFDTRTRTANNLYQFNNVELLNQDSITFTLVMDKGEVDFVFDLTGIK